MELKDLVGRHILSGVDMVTIPNIADSWNDACEVISFILDGKTYTAIEDPDDGYRSSMKDIFESDEPLVNNFPGQEVLAIMRESSHNSYNDNDILDLLDSQTGKVVLSVGTSGFNDWYPMWVAVFTPENMSINNPNA